MTFFKSAHQNLSGRGEHFKAFLKKLEFILCSNLNISHMDETGNMVDFPLHRQLASQYMTSG